MFRVKKKEFFITRGKRKKNRKQSVKREDLIERDIRLL